MLLVQLVSHGAPGEDSRVREKEKNDGRRLSVVSAVGVLTLLHDRG